MKKPLMKGFFHLISRLYIKGYLLFKYRKWRCKNTFPCSELQKIIALRNVLHIDFELDTTILGYQTLSVNDLTKKVDHNKVNLLNNRRFKIYMNYIVRRIGPNLKMVHKLNWIRIF